MINRPMHDYGPGPGPNMQQYIQQLQGMLSQRFGIPQEIINDPDAIIDRLVSTGQIPQARVNQAYQQAQQMGYHR